MGLREKLYDFKNRLKDRHMYSIIIVLLAICIALGVGLYKKQTEYRQAMENSYNLAFFELVDYVQNVENYLAKSLISNSPEHGAETLTNVWREANLASSYLAQLPIETNELANTAKFLNQVSEYSYSLSRKNIYNESLSDEDLKNLKDLHNYSVELEDTLNQLAADMNDGRISWGELTKKGSVAFAQQVSNLSQDSFGNITKSFEEYAGLIYDGAYSEHINQGSKKALNGEEISEEQAKERVKYYLGQDKVQEISSNGLIENGQIPAYDFSVKMNGEKESNVYISITKQNGYVLQMNYNKEIKTEVLTDEEANNKGKEYLSSHGFENMKETYFLKESGIMTINYAYSQNDVTIYPDLIKLKVSLENGEILGIETSGYLNSHTTREIKIPKISKESAKKTINKELSIESEGLAIIPTEWNTEILCWEFKGKVEDNEFLVYINANNGKEENILVIINTPNRHINHVIQRGRFLMKQNASKGTVPFDAFCFIGDTSWELGPSKERGIIIFYLNKK